MRNMQRMTAAVFSRARSSLLRTKRGKEAQIALIKLVDYFFTPEGETNGATGMEGIDWEKPGPDDVALGKDLESAV